MTTPTIIRTEPEARQIARVLEFPAETARYIDWATIATTARELGAHFEARFQEPSFGCTVTFFWSYKDSEIAPPLNAVQFEAQLTAFFDPSKTTDDDDNP